LSKRNGKETTFPQKKQPGPTPTPRTPIREPVCRCPLISSDPNSTAKPTTNHRRAAQGRQQHQQPQSAGEEVVIRQQLLPRNARDEVEEAKLETDRHDGPQDANQPQIKPPNVPFEFVPQTPA